MMDDSPPPPPPRSPPPSFVPEGGNNEAGPSSFKALQQMLIASNSMYTTKRPAPPPKPSLEVEDSPKLEHRTRERPRRKTRAPSRTALREKALFSSPVLGMVTPSQQKASPMPTAMHTPLPPPSPPPPSPPPSLPPSPPPLPPPSPRYSTQESVPSLIQAEQSSNKVTSNSDENTNDLSSNGPNSRMAEEMQVSLQHKREPALTHPLISVVPFIAGDKSTTKLQTANFTFTNRLKQIRERRATQRKSPSPSTLSPTHSASSLPQYLGPLAGQGEPEPSLLSSLSVSPVTSQASLDSSARESSTEIAANVSRIQVDSRTNMESLKNTSDVPSLLSPPLRPTTHPPPLSRNVAPALTKLLTSADKKSVGDHDAGFAIGNGDVQAREENKLREQASSTSLSSSSDCPPDLPAMPPPPIPDSPQNEDPHLLPLSTPATTAPYFESPPLLPDIAESNSIVSGTESSTAPSVGSSGISTPKKSIRSRYHHSSPYRPERRSAFEAMLISESSVAREREKRLSVTDRRSLTLQASRRPDANHASSNPTMKRWSDLDSTDLHEDDSRPKSALTLTTSAAVSANDTTLLNLARKRRRKQEDVANDSLDESGSNLPMSSRSRDSSFPSSLDTENTREKEGKPRLRELFKLPTHLIISMESERNEESEAMPKEILSTKETTGVRSIKSLIAEASINRCALGAELEGPLTDQLMCLGDMQSEQNRVVEMRLSETQEQQKQCESLLQRGDELNDLSQTSNRGEEGMSDGSGNEEGGWENSDDLENDPKTWTVDQVCEWMELVGLGTYRDTFREMCVDGTTLLSMDVQQFAELGVDSAEIRELFLSKIYELSNPSRNADGMQDDFCLAVDSYTEQDWKKLEAAVDALKSPVLRDDIEIDPSAIGQFLHTDYIHSTSTPNIHQLQADTASDSDDTPQSTVPHSSTMHSFSSHAQASEAPAAATDQMPRKTRVPSTRSFKRQRIISMAEAGDKPSRGYSSNNTTRPSSAVSSVPGTPTHSSRSSSLGTSTASPNKKVSNSSKKSSMGATKRKKDKASTTSSGSRNTSAVQLAKNLKQGVIVYENGKYRKISLNLQKQNTEGAMSSLYWEQTTPEHTTGLVRLFMETVQQGLHYKAFLVTVRTSAEKLVEQALERAHVTDNPAHYCIWQVDTASEEQSRVLADSECPLSLQLDWPQSNGYHFELRIKENIHRVKFLLDLPLCSKTEVQLTLSSSATATEAVQTTLAALCLQDTYSQSGIQCAVVDVTSKSRAERALGEKECPVTLLRSGHKLKLVPLSGQKRHSSGQSDRALLARVHSLEQEKAMLEEQVQSAQAMMRSYLEAGELKAVASLRHSSDHTDSSQEYEQESDARSPPSKVAQEEGVLGEEEKVIERSMRLNDALNQQLERQREKIEQLIHDNKRLDQKLLDLLTKDKENVLEMGVLQMSIKGLKEQLSQSEQSREQLQKSLQAIDQSQPQLSSQLNSLQDSLRHAQQKITQLETISHEKDVKLQAKEKERLRAVHTVRQYVLQAAVDKEKEDEDIESCDLYKASRADLLKACRLANRELCQHKLYLDQLLTVVIDKHPEVLSLVAEAQKMRDSIDSDSWC